MRNASVGGCRFRIVGFCHNEMLWGAKHLGRVDPVAANLLNDILPADFANVVCSASGGLKINEANAGFGHVLRLSPLLSIYKSGPS